MEKNKIFNTFIDPYKVAKIMKNLLIKKSKFVHEIKLKGKLTDEYQN